jgi:NB-ARC domain
VIFDDVEDIKMLEQYWPKGALGSIILTTRNPEVAKTYAPCSIEVPLFTRNESEELLLSLNSSVDRKSSFEKSAVTKIADRVGDLPLALTLVASYASSIASSYHTFLESYAEVDRDFLFRGLGNHLRCPQAYPKSVDTTWTLGLQNANPNARMLMETLAFLDKDGLPLAFFGTVETDRK